MGQHVVKGGVAARLHKQYAFISCILVYLCSIVKPLLKLAFLVGHLNITW